MVSDRGLRHGQLAETFGSRSERELTDERR